jgi:hypothetical protein
MKEHDDNIESRIKYDRFTNTGLPYEIELDNPKLLAKEKETTSFLVDRRKGIDAAVEYLREKTQENMIDLRNATTISSLYSALAGITAIPAIAGLVKGDYFSFASWSLIPIIAGYFGVKNALIAKKVIERSENIFEIDQNNYYE